MQSGYTRALLFLYGSLNAVLYSSLLPLWEGFDEPWHYGYVQFLGAHHRFPVLGPTGLSLEIDRSLELVPLSYLVVRNNHFRGVRTFSEYFILDTASRHALVDQAHAIPTELRLTEGSQFGGNYEVHHAPLAYLLMALPDSLLSGISLPRRVWIVRLCASLACVVLMFFGLCALGSESGLHEPFTAALLFLVFSCQMFWATVAHIGNDWLAVPLTVWLILWALRYHRRPVPQVAVWLGAVLGLGLFSKAYFLVFVPLYLIAAAVWFRSGKLTMRAGAALFAIPALIAGPWYLRNLVLYGNLSGRLEETGGVTASGALQSFGAIPWLKSLPFMARGAFWMGNNSGTDFSVGTMNVLLLLLVIALLLCFRKLRSADAFLYAPVALFCAAMLYVTSSSFVYTKGDATAASPWYMQAVMAPLVCLAVLGCQRSGNLGRWLIRASVLLWGYILAVTYLAKLIPMYGGFGGGRSTLRDVVHWYAADWSRTSDILSTTAMAPTPWLVALLALTLAWLVGQTIAVCRLSTGHGKRWPVPRGHPGPV